MKDKAQIIKVDFVKKKRRYPINMYEMMRKALTNNEIKIPEPLNLKGWEEQQ